MSNSPSPHTATPATPPNAPSTKKDSEPTFLGRYRPSRRCGFFLILLVSTTIFTALSNEVLSWRRRKWMSAHLHTLARQVKHVDPSISSGRLWLIGHVYHIDIPSLQVQIVWELQGCGSYTDNSVEGRKCGLPNKAFTIHFDGSDVANATFDPDTTVLYRAHPSDRSSVWDTGSLEVQTQHTFDLHDPSRAERSLAYMQDHYPFDEYFAHTFVHALDATNKSIPFGRVTVLTDGVDSFEVYPLDEALIQTRQPSAARPPAYGVRFVMKRTPVSILFVSALFAVSWLLTLAVLFISVSAFTGDSKMSIREGVLILPVSVILTQAIPALRALWVGTPAFGVILDSWGIFPQMVITTLASIHLLYVALPYGTDGTKRVVDAGTPTPSPTPASQPQATQHLVPGAVATPSSKASTPPPLAPPPKARTRPG